MKAKLALTFAALLAISLVGCASAPTIAGADSADGAIVFSATGKSIVDEVGDPYALITAEAAAGTTARANLLGKIKGVSLSQGVSVGDMLFESQEAEAAVAGWLARATVTFALAEERRGDPDPTITATATLTLSADEFASLELYAD
ncbi:MAG: hypothetical protein QGH74_02715 [Candidatus Brocadiia bacterium]|jgi:hypothetical protein|nr:hypothetical protein [Candidatus Brocadiia bacterium]